MSDREKYKRARQGDIAYNMMRMWQGAMGTSPVDGLVSPAYVVAKPLPETESRYFQYLFRTGAYMDEVNKFSRGIVSDRNRLYWEDFKQMPSPFPPPEEQAAIVGFLDHADRRIRRYIRAKRQLIALLNEQKQALIHRAVTRGLDPHVKLKPSGIEWLGDVPEHWHIRAFARCAKERADYRGATPTKTESGIFLVTAKNIRQGSIDYEASREYVAKDQYETIMRRGMPQVGDVLLTTEAPLGHVALIDREDVALAQRVIRFRLDESLLIPKFALHAMLSPYFQDQLQCRGTGSTALGIKASKLPQLRIAVPPVNEQLRMLEGLEIVLTHTEDSVERTAKEIELLREFRTRLIADVITGKLDVREAAAALPDELEAVGPDADELLDEDEAIEDVELDTEPEEVEV